MHFSDIIGTIGVIIITIAYFLIQIQKMHADGWLFSLINAVGALMILYSLIYEWNLASFLMEGTWFIISMFGLIRIWLKKTSS